MKTVKTVATRCHILRLKCTKFNLHGVIDRAHTRSILHK